MYYKVITINNKKKQKWPTGGQKLGGLYLQNQKLGVCNYKTQLLSGITFTVNIQIKPVFQIYAHVSDPPSLKNTGNANFN